MARKASGTLMWKGGKPYARITLAGKRPIFLLTTVATEAEARARVDVLADLAAQLRPLGQPELALQLLQAGADAQEGAELEEVIDTVRRVCTGELRIRPTSTM